MSEYKYPIEKGHSVFPEFENFYDNFQFFFVETCPYYKITIITKKNSQLSGVGSLKKNHRYSSTHLSANASSNTSSSDDSFDGALALDSHRLPFGFDCDSVSVNPSVLPYRGRGCPGIFKDIYI